jgi:hypothetical protein
MQEIVIKKYIASDVKPAEAMHLMDSLNKITAQIMNVENEMD